ncbi:hypothetical protein BCR44DRAFT_1427133 [Catenaria anguillulae PL171]|uniref:Uncharacterized protein n=1 Tax=Catenaria anguillulae PL171 TaxID=765915 RepID=A0A1Y2HWU2_9FUNG|nr:hypothetical protein BCR44DRAFT_1427133 [Catenaria anguillulae PL171]
MRSKARSRRVAFEVLSLIVSTVPEGDFSQHGPWLHNQVALLRQETDSLERPTNQHESASIATSATSVVQQRYTLLMLLENLMAS